MESKLGKHSRRDLLNLKFASPMRAVSAENDQTRSSSNSWHWGGSDSRKGSHFLASKAHKKLIVANHPDAGGSHYLASKINKAKDVMLGKTRDDGSAFCSSEKRV